MPIACFTVTFPTFKYQFSIKRFIAALSDVLLKPSQHFVFFPQFAAPLLDTVIKGFSPPLKTKSTMDESLNFSLS